MTNTGATATNKQILNQALRHVHYAQAYIQRFDGETNNDYYYYVDELREMLDKSGDYILEIRELNENNSSST